MFIIRILLLSGRFESMNREKAFQSFLQMIAFVFATAVITRLCLGALHGSFTTPILVIYLASIATAAFAWLVIGWLALHTDRTAQKAVPVVERLQLKGAMAAILSAVAVLLVSAIIYTLIQESVSAVMTPFYGEHLIESEYSFSFSTAFKNALNDGLHNGLMFNIITILGLLCLHSLVIDERKWG